jgi:hypothetical protein
MESPARRSSSYPPRGEPRAQIPAAPSPASRAYPGGTSRSDDEEKNGGGSGLGFHPLSRQEGATRGEHFFAVANLHEAILDVSLREMTFFYNFVFQETEQDIMSFSILEYTLEMCIR